MNERKCLCGLPELSWFHYDDGTVETRCFHCVCDSLDFICILFYGATGNTVHAIPKNHPKDIFNNRFINPYKRHVFREKISYKIDQVTYE